MSIVKKNNGRRLLLLITLGIAYGFMYVMPYMKSSFYDQMIAAMQCTNEQLGALMTYYTIAESDIISLHMNLTDENYHMFNKETFKKCKKNPSIVNEGRGALINDDDLLWALENGYIRGAALDMLESENPDLSTCDLLGRDDVLLTPHAERIHAAWHYAEIYRPGPRSGENSRTGRWLPH